MGMVLSSDDEESDEQLLEESQKSEENKDDQEIVEKDMEKDDVKKSDKGEKVTKKETLEIESRKSSKVKAAASEKAADAVTVSKKGDPSIVDSITEEE